MKTPTQEINSRKVILGKKLKRKVFNQIYLTKIWKLNLLTTFDWHVTPRGSMKTL
jgi:hypothetical protein